jgi:hypothetical protein
MGQYPSNWWARIFKPQARQHKRACTGEYKQARVLFCARKQEPRPIPSPCSLNFCFVLNYAPWSSMVGCERQHFSGIFLSFLFSVFI